MKKICRMLGVSLLFALMVSQVCFAAEKEKEINKVSEQIIIEGGVLELIDAEGSSVQGVMRYQYHVKTDGSNLNVRSGPGTSYSIVGQFANGAVIEISYMQPGDSTQTWQYATGNDANTGKKISGYINTAYIE
ncbi:MAG: SH3 domain-containing protein [Lachnospiraceae bacterium]|nr:SH3 domain-containing protein [Lachnospiraceae bacterium]